MKRAVMPLFSLAVMMGAQAQNGAAPVQAKPVSIQPHGCSSFYPQDAVSKRLEGDVTLSFRVDVQGAVAGIAVKRSSGIAMLDEAAVKCVGTWRYNPATTDERAVEAPWGAIVGWRLHDALSESPPGPGNTIASEDDPSATPIAIGKLPVVGKPHACSPPPGAQYESPIGPTVLRFRITVTGTVKDVAVTQSSGSAILDAAAVECVGTWLYRPFSEKGQAVETPWAAQVSWTQAN